jgi:uncharacterized protein (DUF2235 family)
MAKTHILCFDGTWNHPDDEQKPDSLQIESNARRFFESVLEGPIVPHQVRWYDDGVGNGPCWYDRITGGAFGLGLDVKIQDGYRYLTQFHEPGDRLFLVGYSRGAYSARSLLGMIRKCGLLHRDQVDLTPAAYELYRKRHGTCDCPETIAFRDRHSRELRVDFIGVFDTVGALGVPLDSFAAYNRDTYEFHDVDLGRHVDRAFHAMALDEHRLPFNVSLWDPAHPVAGELEQRWFVGSHSDIGGGTEDRRLSDLPLRWMMERAIAAGLILDPKKVPLRIDRNHLAPVFDSYSDFLGGTFSLFAEPFFRPVGRTYFGNEVLDDSVLQRLEEDLYYHPLNRGVFVG